MGAFFNKFKSKVTLSFVNNCNISLQYIKLDNYADRLEALVRTQLAPVATHLKALPLINEYNTGAPSMDTLHINNFKYINKYGHTVWMSEEGVETSLHLKDRPLTEEERAVYTDGCIGESSSSRIYDQVNHILYKQRRSALRRYGFISMHLDDKDPVPSGLCSRNFNQFTSLASLTTTRNSQTKAKLERDAFLNCIGEIEGDTISPLKLVDNKHSIRSWTSRDWKTGETVTKHGYYLSDCILVVDIDNGTQIDYIRKQLLSLPMKPKYIISEKGIGATKQGNSTAVYTFDTPLSTEARSLLLKALQAHLCINCNVFAIDANATGQGFGKNPLKRWNGEYQHDMYVLSDANNSMNVKPDSLPSALHWATMIINADNVKCSFDEQLNQIISENAALKNSSLSYNELCAEAVNYLRSCPTSSSYTLWNDAVEKGSRNYMLLIEGSIYALQYYLLNGGITAINENAVNNIVQIIKNDIQSRYSNDDRQINDKFIQSRIKWIVNADLRLINSSGSNLLIDALTKQYNIIMKFNYCRLADLQHIPFNELSITPYKTANCTRFSRSQSLRGASTQAMKTLLYSASKYAELYPKVANIKTADELGEFLRFAQTYTQGRDKDLSTYCNMVSTLVTLRLELCNTTQDCSSIFPTTKIQSTTTISLWSATLKHSCHAVVNNNDLQYRCYLNNAVINLIMNVLEWGRDHANTQFTKISKAHVKQLWVNSYNLFYLDVNTVAFILRQLKISALSGAYIQNSLNKMCSMEISNQLVTSLMSETCNNEFDTLVDSLVNSLVTTCTNLRMANAEKRVYMFRTIQNLQQSTIAAAHNLSASDEILSFINELFTNILKTVIDECNLIEKSYKPEFTYIIDNQFRFTSMDSKRWSNEYNEMHSHLNYRISA